MLIPVELELLAEGADLVMSLELSSLRYYFIHPTAGKYFYVVALCASSILKTSVVQHWVKT